MKDKRPSDRDLLKIARMNVTAAGRDLDEPDEVWVNHALFNVTQAAEKLIKFLCSDQDIDYDYSHNVVSLIDKLLEKGVAVPDLVQDSAGQYHHWVTRSRYTTSQLVQRSFVKKHLDCIHEWLTRIEDQLNGT